MEKFNDLYSPFRERIGDYGVIVAGVAVIAVSFFVRTDIFEAILDFIGILGMIAGAAIAAVGIFMLGNDKGWWDKIIGRMDGRTGGGSPSSAGPGQPVTTETSDQTTGPAPQPPMYETSDQTMASAPTPPMVETGAQTMAPAPQPDSPTVYAVAPTAEPAISRTASIRDLPTSIALLAILPAALLILSVLPMMPWLSIESGGWGGESETENMSLWDVITYQRELEGSRRGWGRWDTNWEEGFAAYVLAAIGTVANGAFCLWWFSGAARRSEAEARDSLDLLVAFSIIVCAFTFILLAHALFATTISISLIMRNTSPTLGTYLGALSLLSLVGYLIFLIVNGAARGCFSGMSVFTFVGFRGRTPRAHAAPALAVWLILFTLSATILVYADDLFITQIILRGTIGLLIFGILFTWVWLAVCIRRYHDRNKSAWWVLLIIVSQGVINYGLVSVKARLIHLFPEYPILAALMVAVSLALMTAIMFELLFKKGSHGENRYGPPARER